MFFRRNALCVLGRFVLRQMALCDETFGAKCCTNTLCCSKKPASFPPRVMVNSATLRFEGRVSQLYNLPTHELTRFVNNVEFTNCFGKGAGIHQGRS